MTGKLVRITRWVELAAGVFTDQVVPPSNVQDAEKAFCVTVTVRETLYADDVTVIEPVRGCRFSFFVGVTLIVFLPDPLEGETLIQGLAETVHATFASTTTSIASVP